MLDLIRRVTLGRQTKKVPENFKAGDTIEVFVKVKEGEKERVQIFKGVCIKVQGAGMNRTFTVRKISDGIGVERTFPFMSPSVEKVKLANEGLVRRSKLYYLRDLEGKKARIESNWMAAMGAKLESVEEEATKPNDETKPEEKK